ncbi:hypothetical protein CYLTODRAFT_320249, partial [Cylindrobasidium torrendii FP15055 ss-10]
LSEKKRPSLVPHDEQTHNFWVRMNGGREGTEHFDSAALDWDELVAEGIPSRTIQEDGGDELERWASEPEFHKGKERLKGRIGRSAVGADKIAYETVMRIPSAALADLFNDYRVVGLESCILKLFTLVIEMRLTEWTTRKGIIPDSQNGFRKGMRTHNCSFILRAAIDAAVADGERLYVAFVDLKDAFPSTNIATLWVKMYRQGAAGKIFD